MNFVAEKLRKEVRRVIVFQALLTLSVAAGFGMARGGAGILSALYGGVVAVVLSAWLGRGVIRAVGMGSLFASALTRYAAAMVFLGIGMGVLKLQPLPLIVAFAVAQFGFLAGLLRGENESRPKSND